MSYAKSYVRTDTNPVTNLDQDLHNSRLSKYNDPALQKEIKDWIKTILNDQLQPKELSTSTDLIEFLKDGSVLCELVNTVWGPQTIKIKESKMAFFQMENIEKFLTFIKSQGLPQDELFQTIDLYESKDPYQVILTIQSLSRLINKQFGNQYPFIGPAIATRHERPKVPPKPKKFSANSGATWSTTEYGYMNGSNQKTENVVFGARRNIIHKN